MAHLIRQGWRYSYKYKLHGHILVVSERDFKLFTLVLGILRNRGVLIKRIGLLLIISETARPRGPRIKAGTLPPTIHKKIRAFGIISQRDTVCTYWLSGRARRENIWLEVRASWESQIFSRPAWPNSVKKQFIMWLLRFLILLTEQTCIDQYAFLAGP